MKHKHNAHNDINHVVVGDISKKRLAGPNLKKLFLVLVASLALISTFGSGYLWYQDQKNKKSTICSNDILQRAGQSLDAYHQEQLKSVADEIKQKPNFENDPNCLFVVTSYYANVVDAENSRKYLDRFEHVYKPKKGLNSYLTKNGNSVDMLRNNVQFAETKQKENSSNIQYAPER